MKAKFLVVAVASLMISCNDMSKQQSKVEEKTPRTVTTAIESKVADTVVVQFEEEIPPIQLVKKHELTEGDLYTDYDGGDQLADYFIIELIDKDTFLKNKSLAVHTLSSDTTGVRKEDGELLLPCLKGNVVFRDNLTGEENHKEYAYIGKVASLDVYLVSGIYWEDWNFFYVDRHGGKTVQTFANQPYLSADLKHIVSIDVDSFEGITYIDLYEVVDRKRIDPLVGMYVKKWVPVETVDKMYWANDNYLYIPVVHNTDFFAAEGNYAGLDQYIRLRPVA